MNENSSVNEDVKWMQILLSKMIIVYIVYSCIYLLHGAESLLRK